MEERKFHYTRKRVDEMLSDGWSLVGRDPVMLRRGEQQMIVNTNGCLVALS